jgi:hypothetical protein
VAKELLHVKASSINEAGEQKGEVEWDAEMYASSVNYHAKKMVFLLFINRSHLFALFLILLLKVFIP